MSSAVTVSVWMVSYNHEGFIAKALEGVLMQQCNFLVELVIADDCSTDSTENVIKEYMENHPNGSWIKFTRHRENKGMMGNFLWTLNQCRGRYIALCEGDDYWTDPYKLQKQVDFLDKNPEYVLCFHPVRILEPDGSLVDDYITKVPLQYKTIHDLARYGNYIHTPSVVYRNVLDSLPDEMLHTPIGDFFLYMLLARHGKIQQLNDVMAVYRHQSGSFSNLNNTIRGLKFMQTLYLIRSIMDNQFKDVSNILSERIFIIFNGLLPDISYDDIQRLRKENSKMLDMILLEQCKWYRRQYVGNLKFSELILYIFNRIIKKFFTACQGIRLFLLSVFAFK